MFCLANAIKKEYDERSSTSFVSNESTLEVWEQIYIPGGRQELIARVKAIYGVDITDYYDRPIPVVLRIISEKGGG